MTRNTMPAFDVANCRRLPQLARVNKLCTSTGAFVGGYLGWYACEGLGMWIAMLASGAGSVLGVYLGWKLARRIEQ